MNGTFSGFSDTGRLASMLVAATIYEGGATLVRQGDTWISPVEGFVIGGRGEPLVLAAWLVMGSTHEAITEVERWLVRQPSVGGTDPLEAVGGWFEEDMGLYHFDLVDVVDSFDEALDLGEARGEKAIYDLTMGEEFFLSPDQESDGQPDLAQVLDGLFGVSDFDAERAAAEQDALDADYSDIWGS